MTSTAVPEDHFIKINGLSIHYVDWGGDSSRSLLLVHGQSGNARNWDHVARVLRDEFRVIAVDQRGHGDSDHTSEGYAVTAFASDLAQLAEAIGIVPYDYCGASLGARNGIAYVGDYSHHLKHFVCLDYGPEMSTVSAKNQIGGIIRRPLGWRSLAEYLDYASQQAPRVSEEYLRNQFEHGMRLNYAGKHVPKHDPEMFWINGSFGAKEVPYLWDQWAKIECPILELKGAHSDYLSPDILGRMTELNPGMRLVEVPESGHSIASENPDFLVRQLRQFMVS